MLPNQQLFINATEPDSNARLFIIGLYDGIKRKSSKQRYAVSVPAVTHKSLIPVFHDHVPQNGALADIQLIHIVDHGAALDR